MQLVRKKDASFVNTEFDSKSRYRVRQCPCGKSNKDGKFVPYIGYDDKGYCHSCGQTFLPDGNHKLSSNEYDAPVKEPSYIEYETFKENLRDHGSNNFVAFISDLLGLDAAEKLVSTYNIGTSNHWYGATVFWQVDITGRIRDGKIMHYSPITGKRSKDKYHAPNWIHSVLKLPDFNLRQCLFGEHLLATDPKKPVAIVESEKTAIIASAYLPEYIWLACGGLTEFNAEKCEVLKGKNVTLFPDLNGYEKWIEKAKELSHIATFTVSDYPDKFGATSEEKEQGLDIADYLVKFPCPALSQK